MQSWLSLPWDAELASGPAGLTLLPAIADGVVALSLLVIAAALVYLHRRGQGRSPSETRLLWLFVPLLVAAGLTHLASLLSAWVPFQGPETVLKSVTALLALTAAILIWRVAPQLLRLPTRQAAAEQKASEGQLRELTHRSKNLLAVIQAIARKTASRTKSVDDFLEHFGNRLVAIGCSHDLLVADDWHGASLRTLIEQQLGAQTGRFDAQIAIDGENVMLKPEAIHNLGLALHELATNAQKYGALSTDAGRVVIRWCFNDDASKLELVWEERGGPPVVTPGRSGFGRAMVETVVRQALESDVTLAFPATGVRCVIVIPAAHVASRG